MYHLADQLRRSSTSILANIAEGFGRSTAADKRSRYTIARGECAEVQALLILAQEIGVLDAEKFAILQREATDVSRMLSGLIRKYSMTT